MNNLKHNLYWVTIQISSDSIYSEQILHRSINRLRIKHQPGITSIKRKLKANKNKNPETNSFAALKKMTINQRSKLEPRFTITHQSKQTQMPKSCKKLRSDKRRHVHPPLRSHPNNLKVQLCLIFIF